MYCPDCGKENGDRQRFCRSCGASLHGEILAEPGERVPGVKSGSCKDEDLSRAGGGMDDEEMRLKMLRLQKGWHSPLSYAFVLIVLGIAIIALGNGAFQDRTIADIGAVLALLGVGLMGLKGVLMIISQHGSSSRQNEAPQAAEPTNRLPHTYLPEPSASVVEHTTRTLERNEVERQ